MSLIELAGYEITEIIHQGTQTVLYRAMGLDGKSRILKSLVLSQPTSESVARLRHEYQITRDLEINNLVKTLGFKIVGHRVVMVMEDFGGRSLQQIMRAGSIDLALCLNIMVQVSQAIVQLHNQKIIHKNIKSANIIINSQTNQIKLTDFSIASQMGSETTRIITPNQLEGTLAYISPEQTGRMNRPIDYRTDFYSLGVTLYELLTGQLPFSSNDPLELVHCHMAKNPTSVQVLNPNVPDAIAQMVEKMMNKNAEDRYRSASGMLADFKRCLEEYIATGDITPFEIGKLDTISQLNIPQKLYGRSDQIEQLLSVFDRVNDGAVELVVITGYSGIGKTALIQELYKPLSLFPRYFISGKFDQFRRDVSMEVLAARHRQMILQIISRGTIEIDRWRSHFQASLGANAQIIIDLIPELEIIMGPQTILPNLNEIESQQRYIQTFSNFFECLCTMNIPLINFMDDVQWADPISLNSLPSFLINPNVSHAMIIMAYRDNEVDNSHLLMQTLAQIRSLGKPINTIVLTPLELEDVIELVGDTLSIDLSGDRSKLEPLAKLLYEKTQGNPFFLTQLIKSLHHDGLLTFDYDVQEWQWNIIEIQQQTITDNIVDLMVNKLRQLPEETQTILQLASCIGNTFDLKTISTVSQKSPSQALEVLWIALKEGFILLLDNNYRGILYENYIFQDLDIQNPTFKFLHDRVQQAAHILIPEARKQVIHLQIGRLLLDSLDEQQEHDQVFKIVNHFNISLNQIKDPAEKLRISKLNWLAGQKAKASVAYEVAVHYFRNAMALIQENGWTQYYGFMLLLHKYKAEAEFLNGNFERAEKFLNIAIGQTKDAIETADLYNSLILLYTIQGRYLEAIEAGKTGLQLLGIDLSDKILLGALDEEILALQNSLRNRSIANLIDHVLLADLRYQVAIKLLMNIDPVAYLLSENDLYLFVCVKAVNLSLKYGNIAESVKAYCNYGFILGSVLGDYDSGYEFGLMARKLSKKLNSPQQQCKSSFLLSNWIQCWARPIQGAAELNLLGYYAGIESGEVQFAAYNLFGMVCNQLFEGTSLTTIILNLKTFQPFLDRTKNQLAIEIFDAVQQFILAFSPSENPNLILDDFEAPMAMAINHILKIQQSYLLNDLDTALVYIESAEQYLPALLGFTTSADYPFYAALTLISSLAKTSDEIQALYWLRINVYQAQMRTWAEQCPDNFKSRYDLIQAEIARVNGESWQAINLYDQAIAHAQANQFVQIEAIACECAFEFYIEISKPKIAQLYLLDAHYSYGRWGAITKVRYLESQHKEFLNQFHNPDHQTHSTITTHNQYSSLDLATVIRASQVLSGEVVMSQLLEKIMQLVQENAGAQTVIFVAKSIVPSNNRSISKLSVEAILSNDGQTIIQSMPLDQCDRIPQALIHYVERSKSLLLLSDAAQDSEFKFDPYIKANKSLSILVFPIIHKGELIGILYLENNLIRDAFTSDRLELLGVLAAQAAISLENAQFYAQLETRVTDRTQELNNTLQTLHQTQLKLVHKEKMSSLGQLVAGIAHEINNPINFIYGNVNHSQDYINSILELLNLYQSNAPQSEILEFCKEIDLEFIINDLPKILNSMENGAIRVRNIVADLRNFARLDESEIKTVDLHTGLDNTLNIIRSRLSNIRIIKDYSVLPEVTCCAAEINQVFLNLFNNAIDTLVERKNTKLKSPAPTLHILTESRSPEQVTIVIRDNGMGMSPAIVAKIFDPFFTAKPVGSGTGLGLAISHQVIVAQHHGQLFCTSIPNVGSEFTIILPTSFTGFVGENEHDIL